MARKRIRKELASNRGFTLVPHSTGPLTLSKQNRRSVEGSIMGSGVDARPRSAALNDFRVSVGVVVAGADDPLAPSSRTEVVGEFPRLGSLGDLFGRID